MLWFGLQRWFHHAIPDEHHRTPKIGRKSTCRKYLVTFRVKSFHQSYFVTMGIHTQKVKNFLKGMDASTTSTLAKIAELFQADQKRKPVAGIDVSVWANACILLMSIRWRSLGQHMRPIIIWWHCSVHRHRFAITWYQEMVVLVDIAISMFDRCYSWTSTSFCMPSWEWIHQQN